MNKIVQENELTITQHSFNLDERTSKVFETFVKANRVLILKLQHTKSSLQKCINKPNWSIEADDYYN